MQLETWTPTAAELRVALYLAAASGDPHITTITLSRIAAATHLSRRAVNAALDSLTRRGVITTRRAGHAR